MRKGIACPLAAAGFLMVTFPAYAAVNCDFNQDTMELMKVKFQNLRDKYEADLNLIVALGTNPVDRRHRERLFNDWGGVAGRENRKVEIKDFADFLVSFVGRCKP